MSDPTHLHYDKRKKEKKQSRGARQHFNSIFLTEEISAVVVIVHNSGLSFVLFFCPC